MKKEKEGKLTHISLHPKSIHGRDSILEGTITRLTVRNEMPGGLLSTSTNTNQHKYMRLREHSQMHKYSHSDLHSYPTCICMQPPSHLHAKRVNNATNLTLV